MRPMSVKLKLLILVTGLCYNEDLGKISIDVNYIVAKFRLLLFFWYHGIHFQCILTRNQSCWLGTPFVNSWANHPPSKENKSPDTEKHPEALKYTCYLETTVSISLGLTYWEFRCPVTHTEVFANPANMIIYPKGLCQFE